MAAAAPRARPGPAHARLETLCARKPNVLHHPPRLLAGVAAPAGRPGVGAQSPIRVGLGDQSAAMFTNSDFLRLKVKKARYFVRWDAMRHADARVAVDTWVKTARAAHVRPR